MITTIWRIFFWKNVTSRITFCLIFVKNPRSNWASAGYDWSVRSRAFRANPSTVSSCLMYGTLAKLTEEGAPLSSFFWRIAVLAHINHTIKCTVVTEWTFYWGLSTQTLKYRSLSPETLHKWTHIGPAKQGSHI